MELINQLLTFLANPPGNFIYNLVVPAILAGALQGAIGQWRATGYPQSQRMVLGLGLALAGQAVLLLLGILMYQNILPGLSVLPVLDRAVIVFSMAWILWVWAFPEPSRPADVVIVIASLVLLGAAVVGILERSMSPVAPNSFNASLQALLWSIGGLVVMLLGALALLLRRPQGWATGLAVATLGILGFTLDLFLTPAQGDFSGVMRFLMLAGYPLLLTLPMRFPMPVNFPKTRTVAAYQEKVSEARKREVETGETPSQPIRERRRYSTDPKTLQSLLLLAAETDPKNINQYIARSVAQSMLSDLCFLLYVGEDKSSIYIASGYDLIREESLEGGLLKKDEVPMLANAILRGRALRLPASTTSSDLKGLGDMLGLSNAGNLLNVPITSEKGIVGSFLLLSPYSNRVWSADDQTFLANIASSFVSIIERGKRIDEIRLERERARHAAEEAQAQMARLQAANADLNNQIETMKSQAEQAVRLTVERNEMTSKLAELQAENEKLRAQLESLSGGTTPVATNEQLENELRMTLREMARLQNALAESNMRILELENKTSPSASLTTEQAEVIASISQELRQPMSSIIGYADLLLGESVGILGALQRKFIERIRASTERIGSLIDDLIQISTLETGLMSLKPEPVDLNLIIDNAMAYTSSQLREKNITLRIDIPENMPPLHTDREALQQILIHLLQNAGAASAVEGTVTLRVRTQRKNGNEYALIQVTDTGGGIPKEDLPRVFSRLYRADNVLIQGVGDTGVGLSIAKALTEAQGGQIWVDTEMGAGSTFNVLLPFKQPADDHKAG
ncbi:MAG: ATP-binding protein [Anaerolineales bacterium]|nr:ATP-binding protein [Anaerolineales bacterium]MDW8278935.1 ATP-binding protein [Anaerolineales bacterium]